MIGVCELLARIHVDQLEAADGSDDDELRLPALEFLSSHGQNLDWVFDGKPSGMICTLAKHSKRAVAVTAVAADSELLALVDEYIDAQKRYGDLATRADEMQMDYGTPPEAPVSGRATSTS